MFDAQNPSPAYLRAVEEATRHHRKSKTYSGKFLRPHKPVLLDLIARHGIGSALDYGCGKGAQYDWVDPEDGKTLEQAFGFEVAKYDPAWAPYATWPGGTYDLVICTHVLGSIPLSDMPWVLNRLGNRATRAIYIAEKLGPVGKTALSAPEERPVGWTWLQWLDLLSEVGIGGDAEVYFACREGGPGGVRSRRWRRARSWNGWALEFDTGEVE